MDIIGIELYYLVDRYWLVVGSFWACLKYFCDRSRIDLVFKELGYCTK